MGQLTGRIKRRVPILLLMLVVGLALGGSSSVVEASHAGGADAIAIDMDPASAPANSGSWIGSIEACARINVNGLLDADEEQADTLEVDVLLAGIPQSNPAIATTFSLLFPPFQMVVAELAQPYAAEHGWNILAISDSPQTDGEFVHNSVDVDLQGPHGSGTISRLTIQATSQASEGVFALSLSNNAHIDLNAEAQFPDATIDAAVAVDTVCPVSQSADSDVDGVMDLDELSCGSQPFDAESVPERLDGGYAGRDDDGDTLIDEPLPPGSSGSDCDGDGFTGDDEDRLFSYAGQTDGDQRVCGLHDVGFARSPSLAWPSDLLSGGIPDSTDRVTILDLLTFLTPIRYLGTDIGTNPNDSRWDLLTDASIFDFDINLQDIAALVSGQTGRPPMFGGERAMNGPACSATPLAP